MYIKSVVMIYRRIHIYIFIMLRKGAATAVRLVAAMYKRTLYSASYYITK